MSLEPHTLQQILADQRSTFLRRPLGVVREVDWTPHLTHERAVVITGLRRVGKSTLMRQIAERLGDFHYADLDDERLIGFSVGDFQTMLEAFHKRSPAKQILLDEIQEVPEWERFVRRISDSGYKVFLSGSNAKLLSRELGTHLTGRHSRIELFPFSFREALSLWGLPTSPKGLATEALSQVKGAFDSFLFQGGMPEQMATPSREYLQQVYDDILNRDILVRHGIRQAKAFRTLAHYLFSNFTGDTSYNRLAKLLIYKTAASVCTAIGHLEEAYLVFELLKFDHSLRKQRIGDKKIYVIDNGLRNAIAFTPAPDRGKHLKNLIHLELKRLGHALYFSRERYECDFVTVQGGSITHAIQVCHTLTDENKARELNGLAEVLDRHPHATPLLLTDQQQQIAHLPSGREVQVLPVWHWLLTPRTSSSP